MKSSTAITHEFVEFMPSALEEGVVYVSIPFATAIHNCFCGCGNKVVTPLSPTDWKLIFDGETISLDPSIGNWNFDCQSHYWIRKDRISWARQWTEDEIAFGRNADQQAKERYYNLPDSEILPSPKTRWQRLRKWLASWR